MFGGKNTFSYSDLNPKKLSDVLGLDATYSPLSGIPPWAWPTVYKEGEAVVEVAKALGKGVSSYGEGLIANIDFVMRISGLNGDCEKVRAELENAIFNEIMFELARNPQYGKELAQHAKQYAQQHPYRVAGRTATAATVSIVLGRLGGSYGARAAMVLNVAAIHGNIREAIMNGLSGAEDIAAAIAGGAVGGYLANVKDCECEK